MADEAFCILICIVFYVASDIITKTDGLISWELNTKPAVFGKDVQLSCHLTSSGPCCSDYTRKWAKGWKYNLAIINGVSLNILKYSETLNNSANTAILTIRTFQEDDVNIPYECTYGFHTFSKVLNITEENFEYHPLEDLPINSTSYERYMEANITLDKVYPTPECNFTDWGRDLKQNITVTNKRNGLFYTSNIYLLYENIDRCNRHDRPVAVICSVGETSFTVVNNTVKCPDDKPESSSKKYLPFWAVVIASGCAGLVILACISIVYLTLWNYRRTRNASSSSQEQDNADAMSDFANDSLLIQHCSSVIQDESI